MLPYIQIGVVSVATFNLAYFVAFAFSIILFRSQIKRNTDLARIPFLWVAVSLTGVIGGLVGARAWVTIFRNRALLEFFAEPFDINKGSAWYGGFLLGSIMIIGVVALLRAPVLRILDEIAPCVALGQVFGRIGCFLAGDGCYGRATDMPWGMVFPNGIVPVSIPVHPTPLYEAVFLLAIFIVLRLFARDKRTLGKIFILYLILTGLERFFVEYFRLTPIVLGGLTEAQIISIVLVVASSLSYFHFSKFLPTTARNSD